LYRENFALQTYMDKQLTRWAAYDSYLEEREKKEGLTCGVTVTVMFTTGS
jgi:hypothetical protein